jgi:anti-sigma B factor antagonist
MSSLTIQERQVSGVTVVDLAGKILIGETNRQMHDAIKRLVAEGKQQILLNLAKVTYIDSSGLGEMVAGFTTLKAAGGALKLFNVPEKVVSLMTITKLYTVFEIFEDEAAGVASFEEPAALPAPLVANASTDVAANNFVH